jgi:hypothetical protein
MSARSIRLPRPRAWLQKARPILQKRARERDGRARGCVLDERLYKKT